MTSTSAAPSSPTPLSAAESFSTGYCTERVPTTNNDKIYLQWQGTKLCLAVVVSEDGVWKCPDHAKHIT